MGLLQYRWRDKVAASKKKEASEISLASFDFKWCPETESNRRHEDFQSSALPTELSGHTFGEGDFIAKRGEECQVENKENSESLLSMEILLAMTGCF